VTYTQFILQLIQEILTDNEGMTVSEIALNENECRAHYESGKSAGDLYHTVWRGDAGNYLSL